MAPTAAAQLRGRWHPIPFWGMGWTVALVACFIAMVLLAEDRMLPVAFLLIALAALAAFGLPVFVSARRAGARAPILEAGVWAFASFLAMSIIADTYAVPHRLARPGDLNVNTTETMRARQQSFDRWGLSPEAIERRVTLVSAIGTFAVASGFCSALLGGVPGRRRKWSSVFTFGLTAALAVYAGAAVGVLAVATYMFLPAAGFAGGCTAGVIIERAKSALLGAADS